MEEIRKGIVFSNDINYILNGKNALNFSYEEKGIVVPDGTFINTLRDSFRCDVNYIFNGQVIILSEEEMFYGLYDKVKDIIGRYPHNITR